MASRGRQILRATKEINPLRKNFSGLLSLDQTAKYRSDQAELKKNKSTLSAAQKSKIPAIKIESGKTTGL